MYFNIDKYVDACKEYQYPCMIIINIFVTGSEKHLTLNSYVHVKFDPIFSRKVITLNICPNIVFTSADFV